MTCRLCGGRAQRDYELVTPKGRFVFGLCGDCRDAIQARAWPIRAYPPRHPGRPWPVNAIAGPQTTTPRGVR